MPQLWAFLVKYTISKRGQRCIFQTRGKSFLTLTCFTEDSLTSNFERSFSYSTFLFHISCIIFVYTRLFQDCIYEQIKITNHQMKYLHCITKWTAAHFRLFFFRPIQNVAQHKCIVVLMILKIHAFKFGMISSTSHCARTL